MSSANAHESIARFEMSTHGEEMTGEVEVDASGGNEENIVRLFPDLVDERIKSSPEPLHAQISA